MYIFIVHNSDDMSISIAQSRQQISALIVAAQSAPQVITKRNTPVAVLVSADYFRRTEVVALPVVNSFFSELLQLRQTFSPDDDTALTQDNCDQPTRQTAWARANAFTDPT